MASNKQTRPNRGRNDMPTATQRGQIVSYLVRRGFAANRVNQLLKSGMTYAQIVDVLIAEVRK